MMQGSPLLEIPLIASTNSLGERVEHTHCHVPIFILLHSTARGGFPGKGMARSVEQGS